jgi:hypothetical protein
MPTKKTDPKRTLSITDENGDFIFRFPLELDYSETSTPNVGGAVVELIRSQLDDLLKLATLTYKGKTVRVDGFQMINQRGRIIPIWSYSDEANVPTHPVAQENCKTFKGEER